jgi:hypothetical protein
MRTGKGNYYTINTMLGGVSVTTAWRVLGLRMEERSPAMEVSCEYSEKVDVDKRQGAVLQLWGWAWGYNPSM